MDLGLTGRVALVTGASRGIGRQIAVDLAAEGCHVALCGRDEAALADASAAAEAAGLHAEVRALAVVADLTDPAAAATVVPQVLAAFGRLDVLVNNAGGNTPRKLLDLTDADWYEGFEQNFFSAVRLATACVPVMREQGWGRIVNVSSTFGVQPDPYFGPYSAAKAALVNFSKNLSQAYSADGVLSNCVVPGVTLTDLVRATAAEAAAHMKVDEDEVMARLMAKDPVAVGRFGDPAEVSAAVVFLASEAASWITGALLAVDGGTLRSAG
jgi:3-oxoacyl-[acyl-carrier protein] reductase